MTPEQRLIAKLVGYVLILLACFSAGCHYRDIQADRDSARVELDSYKEHAAAISERDTKFAVTQAKLTALETQYTKDANDRLAENSALRNDLAVAQRMRLKGTYCPAQATAAEAGAGVDPPAPLELSEETRLAVFDLRESIVADTNALAACQAELAERTAAEPAG